MPTEISELKIINGNIVCGTISIEPAVQRKYNILPKINTPGSCITFCDIFSDYSALQSDCIKAMVNDKNYYFYSSIGTCITKLTNTRKNNNFGTIRPKNISWKFLYDIKITNVDGFKSYFVFNRYPALYEIYDDDNKKKLIEDDFNDFKEKNKNVDEITCFVSENIFNTIKKYEVEFPFKNYIVLENVIPNMIEILMGKIVSSGNPFHHGIIHCTTKFGKDNETLHAQYIDKSIEFQALRGGNVEYSSSKQVKNGHFVIFYKNQIEDIFLDDKKINSEIIIFDRFLNISNILNDHDLIKFNGKKFISDSKNSIKTHYYKFTTIEEILDLNNTDENKFFNIIKNVGKNAILNIRSLLNSLEVKEYYDNNRNIFIDPPLQLGRDVSDMSCMGKMVSSCDTNNF